MLKRAVVIIATMIMFGTQITLAQDPTPEPGPGAASDLPPASILGEGWTQYDVVSPNVLGGYAFEMTPDVFKEGAAGLYSGPDGARVVVVNFIVTDSRVAVRASWEDATELMDRMTRGVDSDYRRQEALDTMPPPAGCVEAKRVEGIENVYLTSVGATMCAQDPDNVWIFLVSGLLNGTSGVQATDALVEAALGGDEVVAAEASTDTPASIFDGIDFEGRFLGSKDASVLLVVYEDFQCPFCKQFNDRDLPLVVENFVRAGDVRVEWRPIPIVSQAPLDSPDNESVQAAEAAMCAADQNRFWPYSEALFAAQGAENSGVFSDMVLKQVAAGLDLDTDAFDACLDSGAKQDEVLDMRQEAIDNGAMGAPTFLINGQIVNYTFQGYDMLESQLNDAVAGRPVEE